MSLLRLLEGAWKDRLKGGKADEKTPSDFPKKKLAKGASHEREHTVDPKIGKEIAMDHLADDPEYYEKLAAVEEGINLIDLFEAPKKKKKKTRQSSLPAVFWWGIGHPHDHGDGDSDGGGMGEVVDEAPVDWKKTFSKISKADDKAGSPLRVGKVAAGQYHVPKVKKSAVKDRPIRAGGPADDPLKTASSAEVFRTTRGMYVMFKEGPSYKVMFVSGRTMKDLGEHPSRAEAIDAVLAHNDRSAGGLGESLEDTYILDKTADKIAARIKDAARDRREIRLVFPSRKVRDGFVDVMKAQGLRYGRDVSREPEDDVASVDAGTLVSKNLVDRLSRALEAYGGGTEMTREMQVPTRPSFYRKGR